MKSWQSRERGETDATSIAHSISKYAFLRLIYCTKNLLCDDNSTAQACFYACNTDIPAQQSLKLILKDDSLNWCVQW